MVGIHFASITRRTAPCKNDAKHPRRPGTVIARGQTVICVTDRLLTKRNRPPTAGLTGSPIITGGHGCQSGSTPDSDPITPERDSHRSTLDSAKERHRQTDKRITVANLLHLVCPGIAKLGSGTSTLARSIIPEQIRTHTDKGCGGFRLRCQKINRSVKRSGSDLASRLCVKGSDSVGPLGQREESNGLRSHANLAGGSIVGGHCFFLLWRWRSVCLRPVVAVNRSGHDHSTRSGENVNTNASGDHLLP